MFIFIPRREGKYPAFLRRDFLLEIKDVAFVEGWQVKGEKEGVKRDFQSVILKFDLREEGLLALEQLSQQLVAVRIRRYIHHWGFA